MHSSALPFFLTLLIFLSIHLTLAEDAYYVASTSSPTSLPTPSPTPSSTATTTSPTPSSFKSFPKGIVLKIIECQTSEDDGIDYILFDLFAGVCLSRLREARYALSVPEFVSSYLDNLPYHYSTQNHLVQFPDSAVYIDCVEDTELSALFGKTVYGKLGCSNRDRNKLAIKVYSSNTCVPASHIVTQSPLFELTSFDHEKIDTSMKFNSCISCKIRGYFCAEVWYQASNVYCEQNENGCETSINISHFEGEDKATFGLFVILDSIAGYMFSTRFQSYGSRITVNVLCCFIVVLLSLLSFWDFMTCLILLVGFFVVIVVWTAKKLCLDGEKGVGEEEKKGLL